MKEYIDPNTLKNMFLAGTKYLYQNKEMINDLNVFPVPDGDTGTNMSLTLLSAVKELSGISDNPTMDDAGNRISIGTLKGARGNSGVIMSQLCRGFVKSSKGKNKLFKHDLAEAFREASYAAYSAVMKPQEGTILTVAKSVSEMAAETSRHDIPLEHFFGGLLENAEKVLSRTPEMLPVLKEAGVVDSGGQGLVEFLRGAYDYYRGIDIDFTFEDQNDKASSSMRVNTADIETADIKFGYCTEFIIELDGKYGREEDEDFKSYLESIGDSIVCVSMDSIVKVHVHTNHPGEAIERALTYGQLVNLKIDNMRYEHNERLTKEVGAAPADNKASKEPAKDYGFVTVCSGEGIADIFRGLNVDRVIEGGQTMNPSTEDILEAVNEINAETVYIIPNNGNIIMAADQAKKMCSGRNVYVVPTKSICQGISAMIGFVPSKEPEENLKDMSEAAVMIKSGEVTYSVRSTTVDGKKVTKGDYMGICDGKLLAVSKDINEALKEMTIEMAADDPELITVYYGADTDEEEAQEAVSLIEEELPDIDIELVYGGQQVYNYFVSVE